MTLTAEPPVQPDTSATELLAAAAAGDRIATRRVAALVHAPVSRYCRARLGRGALADQVGREVGRTVMRALEGRSTDVEGFHALVYRAVSGRVDRVVAELPVAPELPGFLDGLGPRLREVLVLRVAVGLSAEQTAWALGTTPAAVRVVQHAALEHLRAAGPAAS